MATNGDRHDGEDQRDGDTPSRGVKEDLSELTKTITRQLWGVASFLAPPPTSDSFHGDPSDQAAAVVSEEVEVTESPRFAGIRSDFAELGGRFKSGISILSNTKAVSEISKIASTFLPLGDDGVEEDVDNGEDDEKADSGTAGITDEVMLFVRSISMHPETWLDFPLIAEVDYGDDFEMSDAQQDHALAVEHLEPRLAALRIDLCPSHMSEGCFWKIYFILIHSRLTNDDAEILSTPQAMQARAMLLQDLQSQTNTKTATRSVGSSFSAKEEQHEHAITRDGIINIVPVSSRSLSESPPPCVPSGKETSISIPTPVADIETEKHLDESTEVKVVDKSVVKEDPPVQAKGKDLQTNVSSIERDEGDEDDWLEDETGEVSVSGVSTIPLGNDDDVSFSDLEEEDDSGGGSESKVMAKSTGIAANESMGWVQLNKNARTAAKAPNFSSSKNESSDWLSLDEIDVE
ncbi:hypothetical protein HPP92_018180 [Vanilla planifolia]|uniref:BSD domain-containing protein n=1 Tax=Vanilla planifolia TaxID=51239 RepID=A0A835QJH1_VANPL|nr:hypothetical protein HPP92_018180 [Vanilla planifolia]